MCAMQNSTVLTSTPGEVQVRGNVLVINRLDKTRDEGMYQCQATNSHGTSVSSAQLRVLCKNISHVMVIHKYLFMILSI